MKHHPFAIALAASLLSGSAGARAQIVFTPGSFFPTGVTNEGVVVGSSEAFKPLQLWIPNDGSFQQIGGVSAGNGVGGTARFIGDGSRIVGNAYNEHYPLPASWERINLNMPGYTIHSIQQMPFTSNGYTAVGHNADKTEGMMFKTNNGGQTWQKWNATGKPLGALNAMAWLGWSDALAVGTSTYHVISNSSWEEIDIHPEGNEYAVEEYLSVDFLDCAEGEYVSKYGVVGIKYATESEDEGVNPQSISPQKFAVWYTTDTGDTWTQSLGISGYPVYLTHYGDVFYMLTYFKGETRTSNALWYSDDHGKTWKYCSSFSKDVRVIRFIDENNAILAADGAVMLSSDGGKTWTESVPAADVDWKDVVKSGDSIIAVGSGANMYQSDDNGETWSKIDTGADINMDFTALMYREGTISAAGPEANFFFSGGASEKAAYGAHIYDMAEDNWTPLPSNGYFSDVCANNVYGVSGDGNTLVGNITSFRQINSSSKQHSHAAAWINGELTDLGSMFDFMNKHTTAYAASYDGSVIVGCQDVFGPWFAAVWRKQADGSYKEELMLKDPNKTAEDIEWNYTTDENGNQIINFLGNEENAAELLGMCRAVSNDGKWIGGTGANNLAVISPWIWSEETGLILLDENNNIDGTTSIVNDDGTMAAGWAGGGLIGWIWTKDKGYRYLTDFVTDELGGDMDGHFICSVYDMSPNGRYLTGWCAKGEGKFGYRIDLMAKVEGIEKTIS